MDHQSARIVTYSSLVASDIASVGLLLPRHFVMFAKVVFVFGLLLFCDAAIAATIWEDYQGNSGMLGTSNQNLAGPNYSNNSATSAQNITNLRTISASVANASRTGTSATIDYTRVSQTLCDLTADPAGTGAACQADAQGRLIYARIRLPLAGNYTLTIAHDDEVDLDLSSSFNSTAFRTVSYDIPVSSLASFTANDTTYENVVTTLNAPTANSCALLRIYWNNAGGINHLRLRWTRPDSVTEIIPATALFDPTVTTPSCTGAITTTATSLNLNKVVNSRAAVADQFQVSINSGATLVATSTTSGAGLGQQASTGANIITVGTTYTLTDAMATGSTNALSSYLPTIACTRSGVAFTPGGSSPSWTASATAANQAIVCTITNTARPKLTLVKTVTNDNGGTAAITDWTLQAAGSITISGASGAGTVTNASVNAGTYLLSESGGPSGYSAGTWSCTAGTLTGSSLVLANGEIATCTINNNDVQPSLTLVKTVTNDNGGTQALSAWTLTATGPTNISGASTTAAVTNALVNAGNFTLGETGPAGYAMGAWSCNVGTLSGSTLTLTPGLNATCTVNNNDIAPTITLSKTSLGAVGSFTFNGDNGFGAAQIIATSTPGTAATGALRTLTNAGTSTTITESIPAGYALTAASCSGLGTGGNVTVDLVLGTVVLDVAATALASNITCSFTNTRLPTLSVQKTTTGGFGGPFSFAATNITGTIGPISTLATGTATPAAPLSVIAALAAATVITESADANWVLGNVTCSDSNFAVSGNTNPVASGTGGIVTIAILAKKPGAVINCVFTNAAAAPTLSIVKSWAFATPGGDVNGNGLADVNDQIVYSYQVQNTGNVTISNVVVDDVHEGTALPITPSRVVTNETLISNGPSGSSSDAAINGSWDTLTPGSTIRFRYTHTVNLTEFTAG